MIRDDRQLLQQEASRLGFSQVRIAEVQVPPDADRLLSWVAEEKYGDMSFMAETAEIRLDAQKFLSGARSVVVLAMDYGQPAPPDPGGLTGRVACYAWGRDYHNLLLQRLRRLRTVLETQWPGVRCRASIDLAPVYERAWSKAAGLGWIGKNCCSILPSEGSYYFIATMMVDRVLEPDVPLKDHCGRCRRCLDACPTQAFEDAGRLDARRCISYLTIEHRGEIPEELRPKMGRWVIGCDDCQSICPHTHLRKRPLDEDFLPRNAWLPLGPILMAEDAALLAAFEGSPIRRACPERLKRNAAVALGNIGDERARPALEYAARTGSPLIRNHAEWALTRLGSFVG